MLLFYVGVCGADLMRLLLALSALKVDNENVVIVRRTAHLHHWYPVFACMHAGACV